MSASPAATNVFGDHARSFHDNRYVYPVLSRRAAGISIGVNLNLDKVCNFDCVYCQVQRTEPADREFLDLDRLESELDAAVLLAASGRIFDDPLFSRTPAELRRLNDIALSGDGEPTTYRNFADVIRVCARVRQRHALDGLKIVLITNASMFHRPAVAEGLRLLDAANGEIWAKLDAGTEDYYHRVARTPIPFRQILDNLATAARERPLVIQSLFMKLAETAPGEDEIAAYCDRLNEIVAAGGKIKLVQVHTVSRQPTEPWVGSLSNDEVDALADQVRRRTSLPVAAFYA